MLSIEERHDNQLRYLRYMIPVVEVMQVEYQVRIE
jgi:hypothetical protein